MLILVSAGNIATLAAATSALLLCVFIVINAALIILKRRPAEPPGAFEIPVVIPAAGILVNAALLTQVKPQAWMIAAALLAGIALLYFVMRPQQVVTD